MLEISNNIMLSAWEIELTAIKSMGAGGQKVNKTSSAIHLRFDIKRSSLPTFYKERLLKLSDSRISSDGVIVIKAQSYRTQEMNKEDALKRLQKIIRSVAVVIKTRKATKPTKNSQKKRMDKKSQKGVVKKLRGKVDH